MNIFERLWFRAKTGHDIKIANGGKPVEEVVIRYKDIYFTIDFDSETGEPTGDFGWSRDSGMTHIPVREFYTASREQS